MSESSDEHPTDTDAGTADATDDDRLPDDLVAGDDNPLAKPLPDGESAGDLLHEGKSADEPSPGDEADTSDESSE